MPMVFPTWHSRERAAAIRWPCRNPCSTKCPRCCIDPGCSVGCFQALRTDLLSQLRSGTLWFATTAAVTDCRDPSDNKYLELALAAGASLIVSSDADLLVLHPWRGISVLRRAAYVLTT